MFTEPAIIANPDLGITESELPDQTIIHNVTPGRGYPYLEPRGNCPKDDANRINHALRKIDDDIQNICTAQLVGLDIFLFL